MELKISKDESDSIKDNSSMIDCKNENKFYFSEIDEFKKNTLNDAIDNNESNISISDHTDQIRVLSSLKNSNQMNIDEIYQSINEEERRLEDLEKRRLKLEMDMEKLQYEIEQEKILFRKAIDCEIARKQKMQETMQMNKVEAFNINREEIYAKIEECREAVEYSEKDTPPIDDAEIKRLKKDLNMFRKTLNTVLKKKDHQQKKTAAKIFQKHLQEIDLKCNEQIDRLVTIQKSFENMRIADDNDIVGSGGIKK